MTLVGRRENASAAALDEVAASKLAPRIQRDTCVFKADIRKLKQLGYSLSPRGRALFGRDSASRG